jgi:DGQHR domain-containing protein
MKMTKKIEIPAIIVRQWLDEWDDVDYSTGVHRKKPQQEFYIFSIKAFYLKHLSDVYRRHADQPRSQDMSIQRAHEPARSEEIRKFMHGGFPWSLLSERQKMTDEYKELKMPGWLPTAIVANILPFDAIRNGKKLQLSDAIKVEKIDHQLAKIILPVNFLSESWNPIVFPLEIIDGQHRLYAIDDSDDLEGNFDFPVVAFYNLDITWQAYLFYTINIKPKKINTSLAYDLYPLLRIQDWLEKSKDGLLVYRETRAQELTEILWSHPESPWVGRINMLGQKGGGDVTQAAFIRALLTSYIKKSSSTSPIGGLFGDELNPNQGDILEWSRTKQAAFLILVWSSLQTAIEQSNEPWAEDLRITTPPRQLRLGIKPITDAAFAGPYSLLTTDQGIRGILQITNDMCFIAATQLELLEWDFSDELTNDDVDFSEITNAVNSLDGKPVNVFLKKISFELARFDWRLPTAPSLSQDVDRRRKQMIFKGSSGYKELRSQLIDLLINSKNEDVRIVAKKVKALLKY